MNILQINSLDMKLVDPHLYNGVFSILSNTSRSFSSFTSIWNGLEDIPNYDVVVLGIHDGGINLTQDLLLKLITFRNNGGGILFTHGCPSRWLDAPSDELPNFSPQNRTKGFPKSEWLDLFSNFGISDFQSDFRYVFFDKIHIETDDVIFVNPFRIILDLDIQQTHNTGLVLSSDCQVLIRNPFDKISSMNYYLAIFDEVNKGKVAHLSLGHNNFSSSVFHSPNSDECQLFANILHWLCF